MQELQGNNSQSQAFGTHIGVGLAIDAGSAKQHKSS